MKAALDAEAKERAEAVDAEAKERVEAAEGDGDGASYPSPGNEGKDAVRINRFDSDSDDSSLDLMDGRGPGARTFLVVEGEEEGGEEEDDDESEESQNERASGLTADNSKNASTDPPRVHHPNDGTEGSNNRRSEPPARKLPPGEAEAAEEAEAEGAVGNKGYGFGFVRKRGDGAAADSEIGNLAGTAALTPDSVGPVPFSLESTAPRSRVGSSEPPSSPAPAPPSKVGSNEPPSSPAPSPANGARVERKVSRIAGLLRRFSSRDMYDPADALQIEPLEIGLASDDEYGA